MPYTNETLALELFYMTIFLMQELAGIIKLSAYSSFSLFECRKVVNASKSLDPGNGIQIALDSSSVEVPCAFGFRCYLLYTPVM